MTAALHLSDLLLSDRDDLTVDDVASLPEDLFFELINGRFVLTPAALPIHQTIGLRIAYALEVNCPKGMVVGVLARRGRHLWATAAEQRIGRRRASVARDSRRPGLDFPPR